MKHIFLFALAAVIAFSSCDPNNTNNNVTPSSSNPYAADSLSGYLISGKVIMDTFSIPPDIQHATAMFTSIPGDTVPVLVGSVKMNNIDLEVDGDSVGYLETNDFQPGLDMSGNAVWDVTGANGIPSFSYTYSVPYPSYTCIFPDTVVKANGFTLNIAMSDADSAVILLYGDSLGNPIAKHFNAGTASVTYTPSELSTLWSGLYHGMFQMYVYKNSVQQFGGKKFLFSKTVLVYHPAVIE